LGKILNETASKVTATKTAVFRPDDFVFKDKVVLEIHKYDLGAIKDDCGTFKSKWYKKGFQSVKPEDTATKYLFPMVISEWGFFNNVR
jgi:endoglucanase